MKFEEKTRKRIVYLVFVAAIIYGAVNLAPRSRTATEATVDIPTIEPLLTQPAPQVDSAASPSHSDDEWGRDPFAYGAAGAAPDQSDERVGLRMTAVSEANGIVMAIINGHAVARGDVVDGWTVVSLNKRSATVESGGRQLVLNLGE